MIRKGMFIGDRYEVLDKVGSGGMSDVYKALDHKLNRNVAIKVLKTEFSEDKNFVSKFKVEAQSAAGLVHPNIVNVYDVGEDNGIHYIVMELIDGITLKKYIEKKGPLPVREAVSIAIQVSQGIEAAHNNHIIHRDIKPQNIMISREGKVKVTDFGIARAASANTINSNAMGSVHYISPEQARGGYIDEKSDIYSLGITLYELITGQVPFEGDSTVSVALQHINDEMTSPKELVPDLPISVEKIILKCTQKKPDRRYAKVSELIADLKKSLVTPDEDFVHIASPAVSKGSTVMMTEEEVNIIRNHDNSAKRASMAENEEENNDEEEDDEDDIFGEDDDIDASNPKMDKIIFISAIAAGVIFVVLAIVLFIKSMGGCNSDPGDEQLTTVEGESLKSTQTKVPYVIGKSEKEAEQLLNDANLGYKVTYAKHNTIPKGDVIDQSEAEGTIVDKNTTIEITVSQGKKKAAMPDVIGQDKDAVKTLLEGEDYGLVVTFEYQASTDYEANIVMRTDPEAKVEVAYGDSVTVYVSQGSDTSNVLVPLVVNMSQERAKTELSNAGLSMSVEGEVYDDDIAAGNIVAQDIKDNRSVPRGTTVGATVSKGPQPTTTQATTTQAPTTTTKVQEETTTKKEEETTTVRSEFTATFPGLSGGGNFVNDEDGSAVSSEANGANVTAVLIYEGSNGAKKTEDITSQLDSKVYNESWSQGILKITKNDVSEGTEAKIQFVMNYSVTDADGNTSEKRATTTVRAVFN